MPKLVVRKHASSRFASLTNVKKEEGTYDMNDDDYISAPDSLHSDRDILSIDNSSVEVPSVSNHTSGKDAHHSHALTEVLTSQSGSNRNEDEGIESLALSVTNSNDKSEVSWSDSEGSTYVTECDQLGQQNHVINNKALLVEKPAHTKSPIAPQESDTELLIDIDLDIEPTMDVVTRQRTTKRPTPPHHKPAVSLAKRGGKASGKNRAKRKSLVGEANMHLHARGYPESLILENIDYYSDIDIATNADGLSAIEFLSKEDTREIFCTRLIPHEVPIPWKDSLNGLSPVSSVQEGSFDGDGMSIHAVHTRRGVAAFVQPPRQKDSVPIELPTLEDGNPIEGPLNLVIKIPRHGRNDSVSTIGSSSVVQDMTGSNDQGDEGSDEAVRVSCQVQRGQTKILSRRERSTTPSKDKESMPEESETVESSQLTPAVKIDHTKRSPQNKKVVSRAAPTSDDESSTDRRIRELKEKIRNMKVASTMEMLSERSISNDNEKPVKRRVDVPKKTDRKRRPKKELSSREKSKTDARKAGPKRMETKKILNDEVHPAHARARLADLKSRLNLQEVDYVENTEKQVADGPDEKSGSESKEIVGTIPLEVTPSKQFDDVSTIHCDMGHLNEMEEIDLETGLRKNPDGGSPDNKKARAAAAMNRATKEVVSLLQLVSRHIVAAARIADNRLQHSQRYQTLRKVFIDLWMKHMHNKTNTERSIIAVIFLSFFVLFILLISIIAN